MAVKDAQRIKELCRKVAEEQDPEKFLSLIEELSQLFEEEDHLPPAQPFQSSKVTACPSIQYTVRKLTFML